MPEAEPEVIIGRIVGPFGRRGEVKVQLETDRPERLQHREVVWLKPKDGPVREARIGTIRLHKSLAIIGFAGVRDMRAAEELRGYELRIHRSELTELPADEFYIHDIVGLRAVTENGEDLGQVTEVLRGPANDVYVTEKVMIPALKDVVREVNLKTGEMIIRPIEGMLKEE